MSTEFQWIYGLWDFNKTHCDFNVTMSHLWLRKQLLRPQVSMFPAWNGFQWRKQAKAFEETHILRNLMYPFLLLLLCVSQLLIMKIRTWKESGRKKGEPFLPFSFSPFLIRMNLEYAHIRKLTESSWISFATVPVRTKHMYMHKLWNTNCVILLILHTS